MKIELTEEDYNFLKELQHELNTQENDGNADPVFWGVEESVDMLTDGDYAGEPYITYDDGKMPLEEAIQEVDEAIIEYSPEIQDEWHELYKESPEDVCEFMKERLKWNSIYDVAYFVKEKQISRYTGAFLTKRACKNYIEKYGYNHYEPHTYAMTAFRNFELGKLLNILKTLKFEDA